MSSIAQFRPPQVVADDTELLHALRRGDGAAEATMAARFGPMIGAAAAHLTGDRSGASAAVAAVLAAAGERADEIEPGADLAPWLADLIGLSIGVDDVDQELVDRAWSTRAAIEAVSEEDRELARLVWVDGIGPEQASAHLGLEAGAASSRVDRLERRLLQQVAHLGTEAEIESLRCDASTWVSVDPPPAATKAFGHRGGADEAGPNHEVPVTRAFFNRSVLAGIIGAVVTVLLLGAGIAAFSAAGDPPAIVSFRAELVPTGLISDVGGDIEVTEVDTGLRIQLNAPALPRRSGGAFYEGWLRLVDERLVSAGTFQQGTGVTLSAGVDLSLVTELFVTLGEATDGTGIDDGATSPAVVKVDFPGD